jgi:hypothetical protein
MPFPSSLDRSWKKIDDASGCHPFDDDGGNSSWDRRVAVVVVAVSLQVRVSWVAQQQ